MMAEDSSTSWRVIMLIWSARSLLRSGLAAAGAVNEDSLADLDLVAGLEQHVSEPSGC